jgi:hypothetical protein
MVGLLLIGLPTIAILIIVVSAIGGSPMNRQLSIPLLIILKRALVYPLAYHPSARLAHVRKRST